MKDCLEKKPHFILLGASMNTGNLGVSALLASTVKCILQVSPDATVSLLDGTHQPRIEQVRLTDGRIIRLEQVGVRCNKTFWRQNHVLRLIVEALLLRLIFIPSWRKKLLHRNPYLKAIVNAHLVADITGGDSFSDIYGMRRLIMGSLRKILILAAGADLVLLPQTYGPFNSFWSKELARWIIKRARGVYARDQQSLAVLSKLMGSRRMRAQPQFCPDVAFVLNPMPPKDIAISPHALPGAAGKTLIGINISGLLFNGGYTRDNMFGLNVDYPQLIFSLIEKLLEQEDTVVLLVPHVFPSAKLAVESDPVACGKIFQDLHHKYPDRLFSLTGNYDQSEIKYIIGLCNFFIGSRMHACIAAISQGIPTVPFAYSKKFKGVFDAVGIGSWVADLRSLNAQEILQHVEQLFNRRSELSRQLRKQIPDTQKHVLSKFSLLN